MNHIRIEPVFILGVPRSGTTLLRILLDSHPSIAAPPETPWIFGGYGGVSFRALIQSLDTGNEGLVKSWGTSSEMIRTLFLNVLDEIFQDFLKRSKKTMLVLKTPDDIWYLEDMFRFYPSSKYIHIYRDGRDVACSTVRIKNRIKAQKHIIGYGKNNHLNAFRRWMEWETKIYTALKKPTAPSMLHVKYEDLT